MKKKILIFHVGSIGDTIVSIDAMYRIGTAYRNSEVTLLSCPGTRNTSYLSLLENVKVFHRVVHLYIPPKTIQRFWPYMKIFFLALFSHYDIVFSIMPFRRNFTLDRIFFLFAGCFHYRNLINLKPFSRNKEYPPVRDLLEKNLTRLNFPNHSYEVISFSEECRCTAHVVYEKCKMLAGTKKIVICGIGGKNPVCKWRMENWILLNQLLRKEDFFPIFAGGLEDKTFAEKIIKGADNGAWIPQQLDLLQTMAFMSEIGFYVGHDTGSIHMAAYVGCTCIGIYSSRNDRGLWFPSCKSAFVFRNDVVCQGCDKTFCSKSEDQICINQTSPDDVFHKILELYEMRCATNHRHFEQVEAISKI